MRLIEKLLGRNWVYADRMKPLFEAAGVDMETIGFPEIETRHMTLTMAYWVEFSDVRFKPVGLDGNVTDTIITGNYRAQARCCGRDGSGMWYPGTAMKYSFKIKDGKLKLRRNLTLADL